jgi:hypothetical protein
LLRQQDLGEPLTASRAGLLLLLFAAALVPLFSTPVLPFIDFYNHAARYYVLAHPDATPAFAASYAPRWAILPNVGLDVLASAAMRVLPPAIVPHLIVITLFATLYTGLIAFNRALTGRVSLLVALFTVPLLYSFILNWGFANFLLGLGLMFWALAWWLRMRHRLAIALPVACLLAAAIFFVHGLAFALYGLTLGCLELGLFLTQPDRRPLRLLAAMPPLAAQAVIPVLLFLSAPTSKSPEGLTNADESIARLKKAGALGDRLLELASYRLSTIFRVAEGPSLTFDMLSTAAMVLIVILMVNRELVRIRPALWPAILMAMLLVVICPPALFGVGYVADRIPLLLALLFVAGIAARPARGRFETALVAAAALLIGLRLAAIALVWAPYAQDEADFRRVASTLAPGSLVETVWPNNGRLDPHRRCQMFPPRLVSEFHMVGRLFANATQQPLEIIGPLKSAIQTTVSRAPEARRQPRYHERAIAAAIPAGFDAVLVCDANRLTGPLPDTVRIAAQSGRFTLLVAR